MDSNISLAALSYRLEEMHARIPDTVNSNCSEMKIMINIVNWS
jgi:hypothetical protein